MKCRRCGKIEIFILIRGYCAECFILNPCPDDECFGIMKPKSDQKDLLVCNQCGMELDKKK